MAARSSTAWRWILGGTLLVAACGGDGGGGDGDGGVDRDGASDDAPPEAIAGGNVTYSVEGRVFRIDTASGGGAIDVTGALDGSSSGSDDEPSMSRDGQWLLLNTTRFSAQCGGGCLVRYRFDLTDGEPVRPAGDAISPDTRAAISNAGDIVVYGDDGGPHSDDLFVTHRAGNGTWGAPMLLTGASPHNFNVRPVLSRDNQTILFDCGPEPYSGDGNNICEIGIDGSGFQVVLSPSDPPGGIGPGDVVEHGDYMQDGSIVFEADWDGEAVWILHPGATEPVRVSSEFSNDNTPCVLPNDYIASLWLGRPGGGALHELKVMAPDGSDFAVLTPGVDITDIGLSCHDLPE